MGLYSFLFGGVSQEDRDARDRLERVHKACQKSMTSDKDRANRVINEIELGHFVTEEKKQFLIDHADCHLIMRMLLLQEAGK